MGKLLNFRTEFELELMNNLRAGGFSEPEILEALKFVKDNPLNEPDPEDPPPSKKEKLAEVIPFPSKVGMSFSYRKAA